MPAAAPRRRPPKTDTERGEAIRAAAKHLKDLKRWHGRPPPDVPLRLGRPQRFEPVAAGSYCTSSALLCAEATR